jgi:hypothetical protein
LGQKNLDVMTSIVQIWLRTTMNSQKPIDASPKNPVEVLNYHAAKRSVCRRHC